MNSMDFSDVLTVIGLLIVVGGQVIGVFLWGGRKADAVRAEARESVDRLRSEMVADNKELHSRVNDAMKASIPRADMETYMRDLKNGLAAVNTRIDGLTNAVMNTMKQGAS